MKYAVAVLAKAPIPGAVKTRFCPPFTPVQAAAFAEAFLLDSLAVVGASTAAPDVDVWISYWGDREILQALVPSHVQFLEQRGDRLDDRISNAVIDLMAQDYQRVIVVAADCPTIDQPYFQATLNAFADNEVVLGPANDGGCVLVGVTDRAPDMFLDITMSTDTVFSEMVERADTAGVPTKILPVLHDIDTVDELYAAQNDGQLGHALATQRLLNAVSTPQ